MKNMTSSLEVVEGDNEEPVVELGDLSSDPEPLVKLGNLSPFFFDQGIENNDRDETDEQDPEPLVELGNLSPLFLD